MINRKVKLIIGAVVLLFIGYALVLNIITTIESREQIISLDSGGGLVMIVLFILGVAFWLKVAGWIKGDNKVIIPKKD